MKKISILGSTGSIGTQTLDIVRDNSEDLEVVALAAGNNVEKMEEQVREFRPKVVAMWSEKAATDLKSRIADMSVRVVCGMDGLIEVSTHIEAQILVTAIVGMIGIQPTIAAMKAGKDIALANKETLVTAGHIIMPLAKEMGVKILPVDSEHSAIFQSLHGEDRRQLDKILLTASGGSFRGKTKEEIRECRLEDALKNPNWVMGQKVTIDSASLCNKGLEVMEAKWLFDVSFDQIEVVVHPQSVIHSMVQFTDGAIMAELGVADMRLPIQYALFYPERRFLRGERLDFFAVQNLTFERPDMETFRGLKLAFEAGRIGGSMPTVFNAANEMAVQKLLQRQIAFYQIPDMIEASMEHHKVIAAPTLEEVLSTEQETYEFIKTSNVWNCLKGEPV